MVYIRGRIAPTRLPIMILYSLGANSKIYFTIHFEIFVNCWTTIPENWDKKTFKMS